MRSIPPEGQHLDSATQLHDPTAMRAAARVGRVLRAKWTLDRLLGVGGMAAVYAATHRNGKRAAIKMLHSELSADSQIRERFLREGKAANHVGHPGAVSVADDDVAEDGSIFLVMDLLEGESVESRRERAGGRLDVVDVLSIVDQVLDVLAAAHAKGIVHRDVKPDNLFVTTSGEVKVLDFGIARLRESASSKGTMTGVSMGTPSYMAQEQARALWSEVDGRTDLWAIGATMFACLTGRVVHDGRTTNEQLLSAMTKSAPSVRSLAPMVPREVGDVVDRALAFERADRFANADEMQAAVRAAYQAMQSAPISTAPRLIVPSAAVQRTLPSVDLLGAAAGSTVDRRTGEAVVMARSSALRSAPVLVRRALVPTGAAALLLALAASVVLGSRRSVAASPARTLVTIAAPPRAASEESSRSTPTAPALGAASAAAIVSSAPASTSRIARRNGVAGSSPGPAALQPKATSRKSGPLDEDP